MKSANISLSRARLLGAILAIFAMVAFVALWKLMPALVSQDPDFQGVIQTIPSYPNMPSYQWKSLELGPFNSGIGIASQEATFTTHDVLTDVLAFYEEAMTKSGWKRTEAGKSAHEGLTFYYKRWTTGGIGKWMRRTHLVLVGISAEEIAGNQTLVSLKLSSNEEK
jgi:hypothetical protein